MRNCSQWLVYSAVLLVACGGRTSLDENPILPFDASTPLAVTTVALGDAASCACRNDGRVKCWGANTYGALGDGTDESPRLTPAAVLNLTNATTLGLGIHHSCARLSDGTAMCWGRNQCGELGSPSTFIFADGSPGSMTPKAVTGLSGAAEIVGGSEHSCARLFDGTVACWGCNSSSQLGDGTTFDKSVPMKVVGVTNASQIAAYGSNSCVRLLNGTVMCWGLNSMGEVGTGTTEQSLTAQAVRGVSNALKVAVGGGHACALLAERTVKCWGVNFHGQLGNGNHNQSLVPMSVQNLSTAVDLAAGLQHSCARLSDNSVRCWGANGKGELGDGTTNESAVPVAVLGLGRAVDIEVGSSHSCARLTDGTVRCWGDNEHGGELGDGTTTNRSRPVQVQGLP